MTTLNTALAAFSLVDDGSHSAFNAQVLPPVISAGYFILQSHSMLV
jgi:hypothetical protein